MAIDTEQQMAAASEEIKEEMQDIAGPSKPQAVQVRLCILILLPFGALPLW